MRSRGYVAPSHLRKIVPPMNPSFLFPADISGLGAAWAKSMANYMGQLRFK